MQKSRTWSLPDASTSTSLQNYELNKHSLCLWITHALVLCYRSWSKIIPFSRFMQVNTKLCHNNCHDDLFTYSSHFLPAALVCFLELLWKPSNPAPSVHRPRTLVPSYLSMGDQSHLCGFMHFHCTHVSNSYTLGVGTMAQWLRVLAALTEDPRSNPSTHMVAKNYL